MKKLLVFATVCACAFVLAGCGSGGQSHEAASTTVSTSSAAAASSQAPVTAANPAATSSAPAQGTVTINWTEVATADEAAKGAGLASFGILDNLTIGDLVFEAPKFAYAGGVAQATYETPATMFTVRKGTSTHNAPLTDRETASFPQTWKETIDGTEVTLYGPAQGEATVLTWNDGSQSYGITFQGLGGDEMTMNADTVASIVNGLKAVNIAPASGSAASGSTQNQGSQSSSSTAQNANQSSSQNTSTQTSTQLSSDEATNIAVAALGAGVPDEASANLVTGGDAPHYVVTVRIGNETYTYEVDANNGDIWSQSVSNGQAATDTTGAAGGNSDVTVQLTLSEPEAVALVQSMTGGDYAGSSYVETNSYGPCWYVAVSDAYGNTYYYYVDGAGNAYAAG